MVQWRRQSGQHIISQLSCSCFHVTSKKCIATFAGKILCPLKISLQILRLHVLPCRATISLKSAWKF